MAEEKRKIPGPWKRKQLTLEKQVEASKLRADLVTFLAATNQLTNSDFVTALFDRFSRPMLAKLTEIGVIGNLNGIKLWFEVMARLTDSARMNPSKPLERNITPVSFIQAARSEISPGIEENGDKSSHVIETNESLINQE